MLFIRLFVVPKIISPERLGGVLKKILDEHSTLSQAKTDRAIKKTIIKVWGSIIKLTPVGNEDVWKTKNAPEGYVGGRARGNWFVGTTLTDKTGGVKANKGASYVAKNVPRNIIGTKLYLYNNLPYINRLEYGAHSKQAPRGMVRVSLLKWGKELQKQFKAEHK